MKVRFFLGKMKVRLKAPLVNFRCVRAGSESSQKKKIRTPPLVNDESFLATKKTHQSLFQVWYSFYFVPRSDFLTPTSIYSVACFPLTTVNRLGRRAR